MKAEERRKEILAFLHSSDKATSGAELSRRFEVSRQIIVSDISALKEEGYNVVSTHNGYIFKKEANAERTFKIKHTKEQTEEELKDIVELGGTVVNVYVWHKVYGRIEAPLDIATLADIERFMEGVRSGKSTELMNITGGYHYHTVRAENKEALDKIQAVLEEKGYTVPEI